MSVQKISFEIRCPVCDATILTGSYYTAEEIDDLLETLAPLHCDICGADIWDFESDDDYNITAKITVGRIKM